MKDRYGGGVRAPRVDLKVDDFRFGVILGDGSYSTVHEAVFRKDGTKVALKKMFKRHILKERKEKNVKNEREILDGLDHPGIARLLFTFQDEHALYMGLELCPNGELFDQIYERRRKGCLGLEFARHYAAEIVEILDYLRMMGIVHRDLKPENLLLDVRGHLKLVDFGSAKRIGSDSDAEGQGTDGRNSSLVGTAEYVSPEMLQGHSVSHEADLWALGCIIYQMICGKTPYAGASEYLTMCNVRENRLIFPKGFPNEAMDIVMHLLASDPQARIGSGPKGMESIRSHPFFSEIDWDRLREKEAPSILPFEREGTHADPVLLCQASVPRVTLSDLDDDTSPEGSWFSSTSKKDHEVFEDVPEGVGTHLFPNEKAIRHVPARQRRWFRSSRIVLLVKTDINRLLAFRESDSNDGLILLFARSIEDARATNAYDLRLGTWSFRLPVPEAFSWIRSIDGRSRV